FLERIKEIKDIFKNNSDIPAKSIDSQFLDPQLEAVRNALSRLLPDFSNFTVRRNPLRMEVEKNGKSLTVNQLSGGELNLIAMVGDLARRMAIANPDSTKPLEGSGIVLIDEIDLHLHPKWQRTIVPKLLHVFPNCQFIISTHSPHVINSVQPDNLFLLTQTDSGIVADKPSESYGKNVDRVLEDIMGLKTTRPDEVDSRLDCIFAIIKEGKLEKAQKMIAELEQKIGADPELVKAGVLIKRKELIGK
ncbi:MAG: AAA family ATPase, partial [Candidatus Heimdallarchaeota archaeon]|nr:AAA family ATPase [Candidatus Heimdallarchaeota archaeon]